MWRDHQDPPVVFCRSHRRDTIECLLITVPAALLGGMVIAWVSMFMYVPWISEITDKLP